MKTIQPVDTLTIDRGVHTPGVKYPTFLSQVKHKRNELFQDPHRRGERHIANFGNTGYFWVILPLGDFPNGVPV
jgi:hypothetical protein